MLRIIPAHAGNSCSRDEYAFTMADHPRACGELVIPCARLDAVGGSSPRMRGTPRGALVKRLGARIIPAHAGNSGRDRRTLIVVSDHPRACGELAHVIIPENFSHGSSPRMRGTLDVKGCHGYFSRIIPAHAGNSKRRTRLSTW